MKVDHKDAGHERNKEDFASEAPAKQNVSRVRKPLSQEGVKKLMQVRDKVLQEHGGVPFESSVELIRQEREERTRELMGEGYEDEPQKTHSLNSEEFAKMMAARKQILRDTGERTFEDSTKLIRQMRIERSEELDRRCEKQC